MYHTTYSIMYTIQIVSPSIASVLLSMETEPASPEVFVQQQTEEYQRHLAIKDTIIRTLEYHNNIKTYKTIPKQHRPPPTPRLVINDPKLQQEFAQQYEDIFFQHLDKVITHNTITLELENARLQQITTQTEQHLATLTLPDDAIAKLHGDFLTQNKIDNHLTVPQLQKRLSPNSTTTSRIHTTTPTDKTTTLLTTTQTTANPTATNPYPTTTHRVPTQQRNKKRKCGRHSKATKQPKPDRRFLGMRPPNNHEPT